MTLIPQYMKDGLRRIQTQFPEAVIVGGALRDLWFDRPVKDVDVFVQHREMQGSVDVVAAALTRAFPPPPLSIDLSELGLQDWDYPHVNRVIPDAKDYADWAGGAVRAVYEVRTDAHHPPFQIITTDLPTDLISLRDRVDLSFCQIAYDGGSLHVGPKFREAHTTRTVRYTGPVDYAQLQRTMRRVARLKLKYPDFAFNMPEVVLV